MSRIKNPTGRGKQQRVLAQPRPGFDVYRIPPTAAPMADPTVRIHELTYRCLRCDFLADFMASGHGPRYLECPICYGFTLHKPYDPGDECPT